MFYGKRQFFFMKLHLKTLESRRLKFVHSIKKKKKNDHQSCLKMNGTFIHKYPIYFDQIVYSTIDPYFANAFTQNVLSSIVMRLGNEKHHRKDNGTVWTNSPIHREYSISDKPTNCVSKSMHFPEIHI